MCICSHRHTNVNLFFSISSFHLFTFDTWMARFWWIFFFFLLPLCLNDKEEEKKNSSTSSRLSVGWFRIQMKKKTCDAMVLSMRRIRVSGCSLKRKVIRGYIVQTTTGWEYSVKRNRFVEIENKRQFNASSNDSLIFTVNQLKFNFNLIGIWHYIFGIQH